MEQLPDVPLLMIFRFIDDPRERTRLELVCRRWRKIIKDHGWKHVRRIALRKVHWVEPIGARCGAHLVECSLHSMDHEPRLHIDSELLRLIAENFPALQHLEFRHCFLKKLDENLLGPFMELGARLRSLIFLKTFHEFPVNLLCHFSSLRHLGLRLYHNFASFPSCFFADLRSLYLSSSISPDILIRLQNDSPRLSALYLDSNLTYLGQHQQQLLSQISKLKNLRFLRIRFDFKSAGPESLGLCLVDLSQLLALKLDLLNLRTEVYGTSQNNVYSWYDRRLPKRPNDPRE